MQLRVDRVLQLAEFCRYIRGGAGCFGLDANCLGAAHSRVHGEQARTAAHVQDTLVSQLDSVEQIVQMSLQIPAVRIDTEPDGTIQEAMHQLGVGQRW